MIYCISYYIGAGGRAIINQMMKYLGKAEFEVIDLASFDLPDMESGNVIFIYGEKAKKILAESKHPKIFLPDLEELDATYGQKESRELAFDKLKQLKAGGLLEQPVEKQPPSNEIEGKIVERSLPAHLDSETILGLFRKAIQDQKEWKGLTSDGKSVRLTLEREKSDADINMTFAELYMLRLAIETLKVKEIEIICKNTK